MSEHFNKLTPSEDERLAILAEECSEVIKAVCKIQRHGYSSENPDTPWDGTNRQQLERELGDVQAAIEMMLISCDLNSSAISERKHVKLKKISTYMHHEDRRGRSD